MASGKRIKGLTIEINGDTTGLDQALKKTNSTLNETQRELNDTNKLLKFDPTNTELLTQKQGQLKTAISNTTDKLNTLKEAQRQAKEQLANGDIGQAQYDALQREIIETEQELKRLESEASKCASTMGVKMEEAGKKISAIGDTIANVGDKMTAAVTVPLVGAATAAVAGFAEVDKTMQLTHSTMGNTAEEAKLLEDAMEAAAAQSIFGMSDAATATLNFARAGLDAEEAAAALAPAMNLAAGEGGNLDTVSAGLVATINGFHGSFDEAGHYADVFSTACNKSALDVDSLSKSMSIAAPIFSAAGYNVEDAALYMGVMANNGIEANKAATSLKTGFARLVKPAKEGAEMMDKLGISVTNTDGSMKSSIRIQYELNKAFADLDKSEKIAAASAIFGKNQMAPWLALIETAPRDVNILNNELIGAAFSISDFSENLEKSGHSLDDIKEYLAGLEVPAQSVENALNLCGGSAEEFAKNISDWMGMEFDLNAMLDATGISLEEFQAALDATKGTTDDMAEAMMSGFAGSIEKLKSSLDVLRVQFGRLIAEAIQPAINWIQGIVDKLLAMDDEHKKLIIRIGAVVAAVGPVLSIGGRLLKFVLGPTISTVGRLMSIVKHAGGVMGVLGKAFAAITSPIGIAVGAIVGLVAIIKNLWETNEVFRNRVIEIWTSIKANVSEFIDGIKERFAAFGIEFESIGDLLKGVWQKVCDFFAPVIGGVLQEVESIIRNGLDVIMGVFDFFIAIFQGDWSGAWNALKDIGGAIWTAIADAFAIFGDTLISAANVVLGWFGTDWNTVWTGICDFFQTTFPGAWSVVTGIFEGIGTWWTETVMPAAGDFFKYAWEGLKIILTETIPNALGTMRGWFEALGSWWSGTVWPIVQPFLEGAWAKLKDFFLITIPEALGTLRGWFEALGSWWETTAWPIVQPFLEGAWEKLKEFFLTTIPEALGTLKGWFEGIGTWWEGTAWPVLQPFLEGAWEGLKEFFLTTIPEAIGTLKGWFEGIGTWWEGTAWPVLQPFLEGAWNGLVTFFTETIPQKWEDTKKIFDGIATWWSDIGAADFFGAAWDKLVEFFTIGIPTAWESITKIFNNIATWWADIGIGDFFGAAWDKIINLFKVAIPEAWGAVTGIFDKLAEWWEGIFTGGAADFFGDAWEGICTAIGGIKTAWDNFTSNFEISEWWEGVKSTAGDFISGTWETVKAGIDALPGAWEAVKTAFADIGDWWAGVKEAAGDFFNGIWNFFTGGGESDEAAQNSANIWETASGDIQDAFSEMETAATTDFGTVNTVAQSKTAEVTEKIGAAWDGLKARMIGDIATIKNTMTSAWTDIDTQSTTKWGSVMKAIVEAIEAIKTALTGNDGFTAKLSEMNTAATSQFGTLKSTVSSAMSEIQSIIANTQLNMPNIALPHISWIWEWLDYGDGGGVNIPRFSVDWYAKAMQNGMILNNPTIFGMMNGRFLGGGEAGSEVVAGTGSLMNMIKDAVDSSAQAVNIGTINIPIQTMDKVDAKSLARQIEPELAKIIIKRGAKF